MSIRETQSKGRLRHWWLVKSIPSRLSLINLLSLICLLSLFISGFIFFKFLIEPSKPTSVRENIKGFSEISGAEIALFALLGTALSVNSEHLRQKKSRSSTLIEQWHNLEKDGCTTETRRLLSWLNKQNNILQETVVEMKKHKPLLMQNQNLQNEKIWVDLLKTRAGIFNNIEQVFVDINKGKTIEEILDRKSKEEGKERIPFQSQLNKVLNFFEQMGEEVKFGVTHEPLLKDFFYYIVVKYYNDIRCIVNIARWQNIKQESERLLLSSNFEYLALRWMHQGPPSPPNKRFGHILEKSRRSEHSLILPKSRLKIVNTPEKSEFEKLIMEKLLDGDNENLSNLRDQYNYHSTLSSRHESGAGFFLDFKVENPLRTKLKKFHIDDVYFDLEDGTFGGRAILFIEDGILSYLEVYLHTDEWIKNPKHLEIYYNSGKTRNLKEQSEKWGNGNTGSAHLKPY